MPNIYVNTEYNREQWLTVAAAGIEQIFRQKGGYALSPYRVACGWPCIGGISPTRRRVGECHCSTTSKGGVFEIFISPTLDKPGDVAETLCHELCHIVAGIKAAHGREFVKVMKHVGLTGKPTSTVASKPLAQLLSQIMEPLGVYPHQAIIPAAKQVKPSSSLRVCCVDCGCVAVLSTKWLEKAGLPTCGCGGLMDINLS